MAIDDPIIRSITARLGRPLRVLHIGNIANNAYFNAFIQRQAGIEADVLCYDYYHVMGTPEWENPALTTKVDPSLPDWWSSNLKGLHRPDWFVQGPLPLCLDYLDAFTRKRPALQRSAAFALEEGYLNLLRINAKSRDTAWQDPRPFWRRSFLRAAVASGIEQFRAAPNASNLLRVMRRLAQDAWLSFRQTLRSSPRAFRTLVDEFRLTALWPLIAAATAEPPRVSASGLLISLYGAFRRLSGRVPLNTESLRITATDLLRNVDHAHAVSWLRAARLTLSIASRSPVTGLLALTWMLIDWLLYGSSRTGSPNPEVLAAAIAERLLSRSHSAAAVSDEIRARFVEHLALHTLQFGRVLNQYDIVQGYATDGIIPLVNGFPAYACYEHGTLRALPFEPSLSGLFCRLAYTHAPAVFVTNTDVLPSVERLGLEPSRVYYLPHAFDEQRPLKWREHHHHLCPPSERTVFFSPTRQHWRDANPSMTKGNDILLRAAGQLWRDGLRFELVLVEWGEDVAASRALIQEFGYSSGVRWVPPMGKRDLWTSYYSSHAILDQFTLPAMGTVSVETLALGRRLITHLDRPTLARFFGEAPPNMAAGTIQEVEQSMRAVLADPDDKAGIGDAGQRWIANYHSARRTVAIQARAYDRLLNTRDERLEPL